MTATVTCHCPLCGKISFVTCDADAYDEYATTRTPIQEIFPDMDLHTRELLISGMCLPCQERFFVEDDEDDDEMCDGVCTLCAFGDTCPNSTNY